MFNSIKTLKKCRKKHCNKIATVKKIELERKKFMNKTKKCGKNKTIQQELKCFDEMLESSNYKKLKDSLKKCVHANCKSELKSTINNIVKYIKIVKKKTVKKKTVKKKTVKRKTSKSKK